MSPPPATRLSPAQQAHVYGIYDRVRGTMLANGAYPDEAHKFVLAGGAFYIRYAVAIDGGVYLNENEVFAFREFVTSRHTLPDQEVDALVDGMIAAVIGHEMTHNWRHDTKRFQDGKAGQRRGAEHVADKLGEALAAASGFRPEGAVLAAQYYAEMAAKMGVNGKQRNHPDPQVRLKKTIAEATKRLAEQGLTPIISF
ncbi:MAG: hypothetical protein IPL79_10265 [Myxococcales bacterium]|nr:hypothetical protein [Myxococcales bacterium]